ncbi:hypothetical protein VTL71DRAFT_1318 [Oculimacula yallundae]|uniref:BTB domain-containing protein n=1 Tax=Oculimacula yallundae TaxID=86028 RepID=A0ABR4CAB7_9HELO
MSNKTEITNSSRSPSAPARKLTVDFSKPSALVIIIAGKGSRSKEFAIHQEIISFYSPVLAAAFKDGCPSFELVDVEVEIFGLLSHWFYTQEIRLADPDAAKKSKNVVKSHLIPMAKLWSLAQRCDIPGLQNTVMSRMVPVLDNINMVDVASFIMFVYSDENTKDTPLRALAIYFAATLTPELLVSIRDLAPRELLFDLGMAFLQHNDLAHNSSRYEVADANMFHVGIPEVEEELLEDELSDLSGEDPESEDEDADEDALEEHFIDDATIIAEEVVEMAAPCDENFQREDGAEVDMEEDLVEDEAECGSDGLFN